MMGAHGRELEVGVVTAEAGPNSRGHGEPPAACLTPAAKPDSSAGGAPAPTGARGLRAIGRRVRQEPRAPAGGTALPTTAIHFATDARGRIVEADGGFAPMLAELPLGAQGPLAAARCDPATARAVRERRPVLDGRIEIDGSPRVAGVWRIDAAPCFAATGGRFTGYRGLLRRAVAAEPDPHDSVRQIVHELRTPAGAIQGFAEIIQFELFGPAPTPYRAFAPQLAADSALILAALAEVEERARLASGGAVNPESLPPPTSGVDGGG